MGIHEEHFLQIIEQLEAIKVTLKMHAKGYNVEDRAIDQTVSLGNIIAYFRSIYGLSDESIEIINWLDNDSTGSHPRVWKEPVVGKVSR